MSADVCIVGAGPAGLTLAEALEAGGLEVALIESGGFDTSADLQELNEGEITGDPFCDLRDCRFRGIGGTANVWNTQVGETVFAKYVPLDPIDFEHREWIPWSGWPFPRAALDPYYQRARTSCGLGSLGDRSSLGTDHDCLGLDFAGSALTNGLYRFGPAAQFCDALPSKLRGSTGAMLIPGATVTRLSRKSNGARITEAHWATIAGGRGSVRAGTFVLAAGGIENARLLLLLDREMRSGAPNDWLGRGFMEHPVDRSLLLASRADGLSWPGYYSPHAAGTLGNVMGRIALSEELLRAHQLPNATLRIDYGHELPPHPLAEALRPTARRLVPWQPLRRTIGNAIRGAAAISARLRAPTYQLAIDLEQVPHRDNRVGLSNRRDALGQPQAALHWRWRAADDARRGRVVGVLAHTLRRAGVGRVHVASNIPLAPHVHHHSGTTRMHVDPSEGVVDEHLRVHGEENLFITGSSVFPTAGFANPTLTVIALTLRLGDRLVGAR